MPWLLLISMQFIAEKSENFHDSKSESLCLRPRHISIVFLVNSRFVQAQIAIFVAWLPIKMACQPRRDTTMTPNTASNSLDSSKGCWALDWEGFQKETTGTFEEIMVIFTKPNICERTSWENWNKAWDPGKAQNAQLIPYSHIFCHVWASILTSQVGCTSVDRSHAVETLMGVFGNIEQPTCVGLGLCDIGV